MKNQRSTVLIAESNTMEKSAAGLLFFPGEIIIDILSRLPVDSVIQCKRVCKTWQSLVDHDPTFLALHTHRFMIKSVAAPCCFFLYVNQFDSSSRLCTYRLYFGEYHDENDQDEDNANNNKKNIFFSKHVKLSDKPTLEKHCPFHNTDDNRKIIISCNGLILIASSSSTHCNRMIVFNPVTKEYVDLPPTGEEAREFVEFHDEPILLNDSTSTGFGYHPITKEYKIVRIKYPRDHVHDEDHGYIYVYIYTLGRSSWSRRREIKVENNSNNTNFPSSYRFLCKGVLLNGVVHWIGRDSILLFDLADEEFKILPPPPPAPPPEHTSGYSISTSLGVLGGCLCFFRRININSYTTDIWVLSKHKEAAAEEEDDDQENENSYANYSCSWTKKFSLCEVEHCVFVSALESGKILFFRFYGEHLHFVSYDPETGNYVHDEGKSFLDPFDTRSDIIHYVKSFVSLKALGEEDAKIIC